MSFFNLDIPNDYSSRFKKLLADDIYQKNPITGLFERVGTGGSGPVELPYYLKPTDIEMNNETTGTGTVLNDSSLVIGDAIGNETLNKDKIKILSQLKTNIVDFVPGFYQSIFPVGYNNSTATFERLNRLSIGTYNQYSDVAQTGIKVSQDGAYLRLNSTNINLLNGAANYSLYKEHFKSITQIQDNIVTPAIGSTSGKYLVSYNKNSDNFERATDFSLGNSYTYSNIANNLLKVTDGVFYGSIHSRGITIKIDSLFADLTYYDIKTINGLFNPSLITPTANSKMVVIDPTTRMYNTINIPTSYTPTVKYKLITAGDFTRIIISPMYSTTFSFEFDGTQPLLPFTNSMNTGDKLVLVSQNADSTLLIKTNKWYVMKLTNNTANAIDAKFTFDIFPEAGPITTYTCSSEYKIHTRRITSTVNNGATPFPAVVPAQSIMFCITDETDSEYISDLGPETLTSHRNYKVNRPFVGSIIINCITSDYKTGSLA